MRSFVGALFGLGVGTALWAATGNSGVGLGAGASVAFLVVLGSAILERLMSLKPPC